MYRDCFTYFAFYLSSETDRRCKVTVNIRSLWTSRRHVRGMNLPLHAFLMSAMDGRESSATHYHRFTHRNRARGKNRAASSEVSESGVDALEKRKDLLPLPVIEPQFLCPHHYTTELTRIVNRNGCGIILGSVQSCKSIGRTEKNSEKSQDTRRPDFKNRSKVSLSRNERNCSQYTPCARFTHHASVPICQKHTLFRKIFWGRNILKKLISRKK